jgi:RNA polymerase sigma-70 factor (ECF subfamily)
MQKEYSTGHWQRLIRLLAPIHDQARLTARRLCGSSAEGDDLFQDAVIRANGKLSMLRDESRFKPWFYAVLLSLHRTRSRRAFWRRFLPLEEQEARGQEPVGEDGSRWEQEHVQASRVSRALTKLPSVQREAVVLYDLEGFSIEEIAVMQQVTASAVKSRLSRGRKRLRSHYEKLGFGGSSRSRSSNLGKFNTRTVVSGRPAAVQVGSAAPATLALTSKKVNRHE